ncbi:MAG: SWIM zinc finger domain-containing protein, partial [Thiohalorhabdaceae bacterium]
MPADQNASSVPQEADIKAACGSTYFARGQKYFRERRIQAVTARYEPSRGVIEVESRVRGSSRRTYLQNVRLWPVEAGFRIDGSCSCPMAFNCKHVAAALLGLQDQPGLLPAMGPPTPDEWLSRLQGVVHDGSAQAVEGREPDGIRYVLSPVPGPQGAPEVQVTLENLGDGVGPEGVFDVQALALLSGGQSQDREIMALLEASSLMAGSPEIRLTGAAGGLALQRMVQSGRCFWQASERPALQEGAPRPVQAHWQQGADGAYTLAVRTDPPSDALLVLDPPAYVDGESGVCGTAEWAEGPTALAALLTAPPVPPESAAEVSMRLTAEVPQIALPTPTTVMTTDLT